MARRSNPLMRDPPVHRGGGSRARYFRGGFGGGANALSRRPGDLSPASAYMLEQQRLARNAFLFIDRFDTWAVPSNAADVANRSSNSPATSALSSDVPPGKTGQSVQFTFNGAGEWAWRETLSGFVVGVQYVITFWAKADLASASRARLRDSVSSEYWNEDTGVWQAGQSWLYPSHTVGEWELFTYTFVAQNTNDLWFEVNQNANVGTTTTYVYYPIATEFITGGHPAGWTVEAIGGHLRRDFGGPTLVGEGSSAISLLKSPAVALVAGGVYTVSVRHSEPLGGVLGIQIQDLVTSKYLTDLLTWDIPDNAVELPSSPSASSDVIQFTAESDGEISIRPRRETGDDKEFSLLSISVA